MPEISRFWLTQRCAGPGLEIDAQSPPGDAELEANLGAPASASQICHLIAPMRGMVSSIYVMGPIWKQLPVFFGFPPRSSPAVLWGAKEQDQ